MFHFTCFNPEDPDDPSVGLFNGELAIPGNLLRREVFDPVIDQARQTNCSHNPVSDYSCMQVLKLIEDQMRRIQEPLDALMMVGGFSGSEYLFKRVDVRVIESSWARRLIATFPRIVLVISFALLPGHPMPTRQRSEAQHNTVLPGDHWSRLLLPPRLTL
jgi:hypothetical protein